MPDEKYYLMISDIHTAGGTRSVIEVLFLCLVLVASEDTIDLELASADLKVIQDKNSVAYF